MHDGLTIFEVDIDSHALGAELIAKELQGVIPEQLFKLKAGAKGKWKYRHVDYYKNGEKIGIQSVGDIENVELGYEAAEVSLPPILIPQIPGATVQLKGQVEQANASFNGHFLYDETQAKPMVYADGDLNLSGNVKVSVEGKYAFLKGIAGGSGQAIIKLGAGIKNGEFRAQYAEFLLQKIKTRLDVQAEAPFGVLKLFSVEKNWPEADVRKRIDFPGDTPVLIDRSKL